MPSNVMARRVGALALLLALFHTGAAQRKLATALPAAKTAASVSAVASASSTAGASTVAGGGRRALMVEEGSGSMPRATIVAASSWGNARPRHRLYMKASERSEERMQLIETATATGALARTGHPTLTIFCAPKPYLDASLEEKRRDPQRRALLSWLRLSWSPTIVLLGNDSSFHRLAEEFPGRVMVENQIDTNFYGVPQFHSMVARGQAAQTDISMLINGDIILLNDFELAMNKVRRTFRHWVLTAARWDVRQDFPYSFEEDMWRQRAEGQSVEDVEREIKALVRRQGSLHTYGGVDVWVWNNSPVALFAGTMPPFAFGRGKYDNWFTHEMIEASIRDVVDVSEAVTAIHVAHSYDHVVVQHHGNPLGKTPATANFWSTRKKSSWELYANIHLANAYGSYQNQKGTALHAPWKVSSCFEPSVNNMCMQLRVRPSNCSCEYSNFVASSQTDSQLDGSMWTCGRASHDKRKDYEINPIVKPGSVIGLPHTMEQILPQVARAMPNGLKVVTLVAVTIGYADLLMSFVCRLRALGLADNLVVAALDKEMYRFAFTQGLATYYEMVREGLVGFDEAHCPFGSQCFRKFTKLKSRAVLRVIRAGYSVLWTDVDIVWFKDPLPHLLSFGPGTFPVQSNEPKSSLPGTGIRRINSGFYLARADQQTVEAFEAITAHAATTKLSEQPSFYDILCGPKGERVVRGKEMCVWENGLKTVFLSRAMYPNGAVYDLWDKPDVTQACHDRGASILHNNWILGRDAKMERFTKNGFWHYDPTRRLCIWPWHSSLPHVIPLSTDENLKADERR